MTLDIPVVTVPSSWNLQKKIKISRRVNDNISKFDVNKVLNIANRFGKNFKSQFNLTFLQRISECLEYLNVYKQLTLGCNNGNRNQQNRHI